MGLGFVMHPSITVHYCCSCDAWAISALQVGQYVMTLKDDRRCSNLSAKHNASCHSTYIVAAHHDDIKLDREFYPAVLQTQL